MKIKNLILFLAIGASSISFFSCSKDAVETIIDSSLPNGAFTASKSGAITAQNDTGSKGTVSIGSDAKGTVFLKLGTDFQTVLATGTVTVYLSTSSSFKADPGNGNPDLKLVGIIAKNGETYFKLAALPEAKFTHVIFWCGTAGIPFGNANFK
jgi:hypothetical protein